MASPILNLQEMEVSQAGKYLTHNKDNRILEGFSYNLIQNIIATPPSHIDGYLWIVATSATGDWAGEDNKFALSVNGEWFFVSPADNVIVYNAATDSYYQWNGSIWNERPTTKGNVAYDNGTSTATTDIDFSNGLHQELELGDNTTLTFSNVPSYPIELTLKVTQGASAYTLAYPASVVWASGSAPTISAGASAVDVLKFYSIDGGVTFYGSVIGQAFS